MWVIGVILFFFYVAKSIELVHLSQNFLHFYRALKFYFLNLSSSVKPNEVMHTIKFHSLKSFSLLTLFP